DDSELAVRVARESSGNPMLARELVEHVREGRDLNAVTLEDVLGARVRSLPETARMLLNLLAVGAGPLATAVLGRATASTDQAVLDGLDHLRESGLVRLDGGDQWHSVEILHDRIRETALAQLSPPERIGCHLRVAMALVLLRSGDHEAIAEHYRAAGRTREASEHVLLAAERAMTALAFERAARLYASASELEPGGERGWQLRKQCAEALAYAGRASEAAEAFKAAARSAPAPHHVECARLAAHHLLRWGRFDEGLDVLRAVLAAVGLKSPVTPKGVVRSLLLQRARVWARGLRSQIRTQNQIPPQELQRIDVLWSAGEMGTIDTIRSAEYQSRHLLLALRAGEPYRLARALALEAVYHANAGPRGVRHGVRLLDRADELAREHGSEHARAIAMVARALVRYQGGGFAEALALMDEAGAILRGCAGLSYEQSTARMVSLWALYYRGEMTRLAALVPSILADAAGRGDIFTETSTVTGLPNAVWLADDEPRQARTQLDRARRKWTKQGFHLQHYWNLMARVNVCLYEGDGVGAWAEIERDWPALSSSMLLRVWFVRLEFLGLRARAAIAASATGGSRCGELRARARADARRLRRSGTGWVIPQADSIDAALAPDGQAVLLLERAERGYIAAGMAMHALAARRWRGVAAGGPDGGELTTGAERALRERGIRRPARFAQVLAPGGPTETP
ncbi:MAG TPA: hypothetical protein VML75_11695, partial [Kofleriaceae bacterium]|nr:hypothetical protein [Kofleriaceae bacterium]